MPVERSVGAIIFRKNKEIKYLSLHYPSGSRTPGRDYWDFPKGHIEKGEKEIDTAKREVREETGLEDLEFVEGFKETIKYFFKFKGETIFKIVTFYLGETKTQEIKISQEHIDYKWLPYEETIERLAFKNAKEILKKANDFLKNYERQGNLNFT